MKTKLLVVSTLLATLCAGSALAVTAWRFTHNVSPQQVREAYGFAASADYVGLATSLTKSIRADVSNAAPAVDAETVKTLLRIRATGNSIDTIADTMTGAAQWYSLDFSTADIATLQVACPLAKPNEKVSDVIINDCTAAINSMARLKSSDTE